MLNNLTYLESKSLYFLAFSLFFMVNKPLVYGLSLLLSYVPLASRVQADDGSKPDSVLEQTLDESLKPMTLVELFILNQTNKMIESYNEMPDELYVSRSSLEDSTHEDFYLQPICLDYLGLEAIRELHEEPILLEGYESGNLRRDAHELFMFAYRNFIDNVMDSLRADNFAIGFNIRNFKGEDITFIGNYRSVISSPD